MKPYTTIAKEASDEFTERRSRFIGSIRPVKAPEEAAAFVAELKAKYWDATHNCSAYSLNGGLQRYSDDGEPHGTAGVPILEVLKKENVTDAVIVVTRYFGGVLLGAGGLVRAYSHAAKLALDAGGRLEMRPCTVFSLDIPYQMYDRIAKLVKDRGVAVLDSDFGIMVRLRLRIYSEGLAGFTAALTEHSGGAITPAVLYEEFA
jgi:uncharacterized YigZ family protein